MEKEIEKEESEQKDQAKKAHMGWVSQKDKMRIRLPERGIERDTVAQLKPRRFDFSKKGDPSIHARSRSRSHAHARDTRTRTRTRTLARALLCVPGARFRLDTVQS